jgi:hypothetical protein
LLGLADLLAELVEAGADGVFGAVGIGVNAAAEPVRGALDAVAELVRIHAAERVAQLGRDAGLERRELALGVAQLLFQAGETVREDLAVVSEAVAVGEALGECVAGVRLRGLRAFGGLRGELADAFGLGALLGGEAIGFMGECTELSVGLSLLGAAEEAGGLLELVGGAAGGVVGGLLGFGLAGLRAGGATHLVVGGAETAEGLLDARVGGGLWGLGAGLG